MSSVDRSAGFLAGVILGGLVGAAVGLLLAPQAGEETREQLRERGIELKGRADELKVRGRTIVDETTAQMREAVEEGRRAAERTRADLEARLQAERGREVQPERGGQV